MKILKNIILLLILFTASFCTNDNSAVEQEIAMLDTSNSKISPLIVVPDTTIALPLPTFQDFIKFTETSSILQTNETKLFYRPQDKGFYGYYTLFHRKPKYELQGELKIFSKRNDGTGWKESDTDQVFIQTIITGDKIKFLNKISIGDSKVDLIKVFGESKINLVDTFVCYDKFQTVGIFILQADKLTKIIYGRYDKQKLSDRITVEQIRNITNVP
jgi:hypothetical protein